MKGAPKRSGRKSMTHREKTQEQKQMTRQRRLATRQTGSWETRP